MLVPSMATAAPVLPELAATTVPPGRSLPEDSALSRMFFTILSFIEKPGLRNSHLARTITWRQIVVNNVKLIIFLTPGTLGLANEVISTSGVWPEEFMKQVTIQLCLD